MKERTVKIDKRKYETPMWLFDKLDEMYGPFTLDPCAEPETAKCDRYFTVEDNGLLKSWEGETVFMNPPFGKPERACLPGCNNKRCKERGHHMSHDIPGTTDWLHKAYNEVVHHGATVIGVIPSSTGTRWFHDYVMKASEIIFIRGRVSYLFEGKPTGSPDFDTIIAVWKPGSGETKIRTITRG